MRGEGNECCGKCSEYNFWPAAGHSRDNVCLQSDNTENHVFNVERIENEA